MAKITDHSRDKCLKHNVPLKPDWAEPDIFLICEFCPWVMHPRRSVVISRPDGICDIKIVGYNITEEEAEEASDPPDFVSYISTQ